MLASLDRISLSSADGGTYSNAADRYSKKLALMPPVVAGTKSIFGAAGGAG
ncbi:hypothetical protein D3C76_1800860 [compost metagenome]